MDPPVVVGQHSLTVVREDTRPQAGMVGMEVLAVAVAVIVDLTGSIVPVAAVVIPAARAVPGAVSEAVGAADRTTMEVKRMIKAVCKQVTARLSSRAHRI